MAKQDWDWPSDLTPARRTTSRSVRPSAGPSTGDRVGELIEAVEKLADQLRRVEAKVDMIHERLLGLAAGETTSPDITRIKSRIQAASTNAAASVTRQSRKRPRAMPGAEHPV